MNKASSAVEAARRGKGFTLIELLIVISIIGIISAVAAPSYGKYAVRAKVNEAVQLNEMVRLALIQYHMEHGKFVDNYSDLAKRNKAIGLESTSTYESGVIKKMWVGSRGVTGKDSTSAHIAILLDPALKLSSGNSMLLSTVEFINGSYKYICGDTNAVWPSNIDHQFLPSSCAN